MVGIPQRANNPKGSSKVAHLEVPAVFAIQSLEETLGTGHWCPYLLPQPANKGHRESPVAASRMSGLSPTEATAPTAFLPTHQQNGSSSHPPPQASCRCSSSCLCHLLWARHMLPSGALTSSSTIVGAKGGHAAAISCYWHPDLSLPGSLYPEESKMSSVSRAPLCCLSKDSVHSSLPQHLC